MPIHRSQQLNSQKVFLFFILLMSIHLRFANSQLEEFLVDELAGKTSGTRHRRMENPMWMNSGKFQGDIDGVTAEDLQKAAANGNQFNALRNRQLTWANAIVPYELDERFSK